MGNKKHVMSDAEVLSEMEVSRVIEQLLKIIAGQSRVIEVLSGSVVTMATPAVQVAQQGGGGSGEDEEGEGSEEDDEGGKS